MNKKTMMLGGLLAAVAITANSVSGTYAKYTSKIDLVDDARVAQWQLVAVDKKTSTVTDKLNLFHDSYSLNDKGLYVKSLNDNKVVAPGTKGEYEIRLAGDMEVRYALNLAFEGDEPMLYYDPAYVNKKGETVFYKGTYALGSNCKEYHPISYKITLFDSTKTYLTATGSLEEITTALNTYNESAEAKKGFEPGRVGLGIKIEWSWDAENEVTGLTRAQVDEMDTYLGTDVNGKYEKYDESDNFVGYDFATREYKLSVTATQVAENHSTETPKVGA